MNFRDAVSETSGDVQTAVSPASGDVQTAVCPASSDVQTAVGPANGYVSALLIVWSFFVLLFLIRNMEKVF